MSEASFTSLRLPPAAIAFCLRHINLHRVLLTLTAISFFIAWNRGLALLYGLFSLLAALLLLSYLLPLLQLRNLRVQLIPHGEFWVGQDAQMLVKLTAPAGRYQLLVQPELVFVAAAADSVFFSQVENSAQQVIKFSCQQRGCFVVRQVNISSAYPFGIFTYQKTLNIEPTEFLVFPQPLRLNHGPQALSAELHSLGNIIVQHSGGQDEFAALRDYRYGDELRHIHWAASARTNTLVIKEFERMDQPKLLIAINSEASFNLGEGNSSSFEMSVRLVAALIEFASSHGMPCYLVAADYAVWQLHIPAYNADFYNMYEQLARLQCCASSGYDDLLAEAQQRYPDTGLLVSFRRDDTNLAVPIAPQTTHIDLVLNSNSFHYPAQQPSRVECVQQGKRLTYSICATTPLEDLFR